MVFKIIDFIFDSLNGLFFILIIPIMYFESKFPILFRLVMTVLMLLMIFDMFLEIIRIIK